MSNYPKPSFVISQSNFSLIWFEATNKFLVVQDALGLFFSEAVVQSESDYQEALKMLLGIHPEITNLIQIISEDNTNSLAKNATAVDCKHFQLNDFKTSTLAIGQDIVSVYYSSKSIQMLFEAPYAYLKSNYIKSDKELTIIENDNKLSLYSNKKFVYVTSKEHFFVLQSQFANKLIEFYHNINKPDWICAFHACAVQKNDKIFLFLGDSGAGKSTLSTLLSLSGCRFIADDLVLMDHNFKIYDNPAAVSIKEKAWPVIESFFNSFRSIETSNKTKGQTKMKFLPLHELQNNSPQSFNLYSLVWVNYSKDQTNCLSPLDTEQALSRLIPDTWINPELISAKAFSNWALEVKTYHLDYYDFNTAKKLLDAQLR